MFQSTAFPRIPYFSETEKGEEELVPEPKNTSTPPAIPFDSLVQTTEARREKEKATDGNDSTTLMRNSASVKRYEEVAATVKTEEAREFLAALVFLGTRSVSRTSPVAVEKL